jgi:hypothetical protein
VLSLTREISLTFSCPLSVFGQQPSHYILGDKDLEGIDLYSIHHAWDKNYYFATSNELIIYDGYSFEPANCSDVLLSFVFNLVEDYTGNVYCVNLSGQIFNSGRSRCSY